MGNPAKSAWRSYMIEEKQIRMKASFLFKLSKGMSLFKKKKKTNKAEPRGGFYIWCTNL